MKRKIGQITIKKLGKKYAACISGTPQSLFDSFREAEEEVKRIRKRLGRRNYSYMNR